ncbi:MAG: thiamine-phosphate kinase [Halobacteriota archaeon]|jgi:thiamine-monophosphate kinase
MKVGELGERALVNLMAELIECTAVLCPGADDCSAIAYGDHYLVVTTDMLHKKTHFPREMTGFQVGWMATAATLSDIAAMGASPIGVTMAVGIPRDTDVAFALDVMRGCNACCTQNGTTLLAGDTDEHDELTLVGTAIGSVQQDKMLTRAGATVGDVVCVTGELGLAAAGVKMLLESRFADHRLRERALKKLFEPEPRIVYGQALADSGAVTALIDTSDGLSLSLYELSKASNCGFYLRAADLPISEEAKSVSHDRWEELTLAIYRGGDYELLFTARDGLLAAIPIPYTIIGKVTQSGMQLEVDGVVQELKAEGYEHLTASGPRV